MWQPVTFEDAHAAAGALKSAAKGSPEYIEASTVTGLADKCGDALHVLSPITRPCRYLLSWSYWMFKPFHDITTQAVCTQAACCDS
jgi:hypothetical protein